MGPICIGFVYNTKLFAFVFPLGCVYSCSLLPCTFDGWVPILDFYTGLFFFFGPPPLSLILASFAKYENFIRSQYEMLKLSI
jgi:hypothetical protein